MHFMAKQATVIITAIVIAAIAVALALIPGAAYSHSGAPGNFSPSAQEGKLLWSYEVGEGLYVLAASGGTVYAGVHDDLQYHLYALDAVTGNLLWRHQTGDRVSYPVVSGSVVYVGSLDNFLYALDAATGVLLWRYRTVGDVRSAPVVSGGVVYVGSDHLYALDVATGELHWQYETTEIVFSPVVSGGVVYIGSRARRDYLKALDAVTGELLWQWTHPFRNSNDRTSLTSSPMVSDGVVYAGWSFNGWNSGVRWPLYAFDSATGDTLWQRQTDSVVSKTVVSDGAVYAGSDDLDVWDAFNGGLHWSYQTDGNVHAPEISGGVVYIGSEDKHLYALDAATGAFLWRYDTSGDVRLYGVDGGVLHVVSGSNLYELNATTGDLLWGYDTDGEVSSFAKSSGAVYVASEGQLYAIGASELMVTPTPPPPTPSPTIPRLTATTPSAPLPTTRPTPTRPATPTPKPPTPIGRPTVNFHASQTQVTTGEPVVLTLSVANSIIKPEMTLQLVLQLPSGVVVSGEGLSGECSVQCSVIYKVPTGENKEFPLKAVANQPGPFDIKGRMEWYFGDDVVTTHDGEVGTLRLEAVAPVATPAPTPVPTLPPHVGNPTVNLHATQTEVQLGEPVKLQLSVVNSIAKPEMTLKLILPVPSGWSMSGSGFAESCTGQCTATYTVPSGKQRSIDLEMQPNQPGSFTVEAKMEWWFGDDVTTLTGDYKDLVLNVVGPPTPTHPPTPTPFPTAIPAPIAPSGNNGGGGCGVGFSGSGDLALLALLALPLAGSLARPQIAEPALPPLAQLGLVSIAGLRRRKGIP